MLQQQRPRGGTNQKPGGMLQATCRRQPSCSLLACPVLFLLGLRSGTLTLTADTLTADDANVDATLTTHRAVAQALLSYRDSGNAEFGRRISHAARRRHASTLFTPPAAPAAVG
mmetsp:Transcript_25150/g.74324  ORF Transcript_25150/g.74324 Transcript_25150/m.74324 type:complete len:114 (-) Transcript_25150:1443-1784(-)|eukprot:362255-Chlamydomonas_euryale.AAC.3